MNTAHEFTIFKNAKLYVAPTHARDVVVVEGSVLGGPNMLPVEKDVVASLAASLYDAGTATKGKEQIRENLSARGISLSFQSEGDWTSFSGRCFPEDLSRLLAAIVECLKEASFPEQEVEVARAVTLGDIDEAKSDTRAHAERSLAQMLYSPSHPNYARSLEDLAKSVASTTRADLKAFQKMLGTNGLVLAIAGDVEVATTRRAVEKTFAKLGSGTAEVTSKQLNTKEAKAREVLTPIADKANVDVCFGLSLPVTLTHPLYYPAQVLFEMLGGRGFTAHLMKTIRERDGLTYGVYARLSGVTKDTDGYLKIFATFSPDRYAESVAALRREIDIFFAKGLTKEALSITQGKLSGAHLVSLSTTQNLASSLHWMGKNDISLSYLENYPNIVRAVTIPDLKRAAALIALDKLALAASGTFVK
jgi:zinc protease